MTFQKGDIVLNIKPINANGREIDTGTRLIFEDETSGWCHVRVPGESTLLQNGWVSSLFEPAPPEPSEPPAHDDLTVRSTHAPSPVLPTESAARKNIPLVRGLLDYFPAALAAVAEVSRAGNEKHNPGEPMHHARGKSMDHADCILRHLVDRGSIDPDDGQRHSAKVAWRALALLQEELEANGAAFPRGAKK